MRRTLALLFSVAAAACGSSSDSGSTGPGTPQTAYSLSADSAFLIRTALIGTPLPTTVHVELGGVAASNVEVSWFPTTGSGSVSAKTSTTDANGNASVTWTLGDTARVDSLTATAGTGSVNFAATATSGTGVTLSKVSADSTKVVAGASALLSVRLVDSFGNPVPGVTINWTVTGGGSLSEPTSITGSSGHADVVLVTSPTPATYAVTASAVGIVAVTFTITGF